MQYLRETAPSEGRRIVIVPAAEMKGVTFGDDLRQLALRPGQPQVGAVGFDRTFTLCDLAADGAPVQTCRTHGPVSSLRWDEVGA